YKVITSRGMGERLSSLHKKKVPWLHHDEHDEVDETSARDH
ncbi:unnamed protein product, partial [Rotaria sordida]